MWILISDKGFIPTVVGLLVLPLLAVGVCSGPDYARRNPAPTPPGVMERAGEEGGLPFDAVSSPPISQFRGDAAHQGVFPNASVRPGVVPAWSVEGFNFNPKSAAKASPAVDDSGIYVGSDLGTFYAFDHDGRQRWSFGAQGAQGGIHATAALDDQRAYIGAYNGWLYALEKGDGALAWGVKLGQALGASPTLVGEDIYVCVETNKPTDGYVAKLSRRTGELIWKSMWLGEQSHSTPTVSLKHRTVMVGGNNHFFFAFDMDTGAQRWVRRLDSSVKDTGAVIDDGDRVYFTTSRGTVWALEIADGTVGWRHALGTGTRSSPSYVSGADLLVVAVTGRFSGWSRRGAILGLDRTSGQVRWRYDERAGHDSPGTAAVVPGGEPGAWDVWIACGFSGLCVLDGSTGALQGRTDLPRDLTGMAVPYGDSIYIALRNGPLIALGPERGADTSGAGR